LQHRIALEYCAKVGLPDYRAERVVHKMRVAVHEERFADIGLPQQWPINRARRGNLVVGQSAPTVPLRTVMIASQDGCSATAEVGQAVQFPKDVCQAPHTVVVAGSYS